MSDAGGRRVEVDALKAAGILTIVFIHSIRSPWDAGVSTLEVWLGHVTRFGVPAFLFASGYLYTTRRPVPAATTLARLRRILLPYLVASLAAQAWSRARGVPTETGSPALDLLLGASFGPFYYVFVITLLVLATPLLARLGTRIVAVLALVFVAAQWCVDAATLWLLPLFWHLRSPLLWWGYFLLGWLAGQHKARLEAWIAPRRGVLVAALLTAVLALAALSGLEGHAPRLLVRTAAWLAVYAIGALLFAATLGRARSGAILRGLSDATYTIYLFHLFFVLEVKRLVPPPPGELAPLAALLPWAAGIAGPLLLIAGARALLGRRSRDWIGT
jgi:surface polysaccharide O-acyltransferase-like enzyme